MMNKVTIIVNYALSTKPAHHSPSSSAEVKNGWSYTSIPPYACMEYTGMHLALLIIMAYCEIVAPSST